MKNSWSKILILLTLLVLTACNQSKKEDKVSGPTTPTLPQVSSIGGGSYVKEASNTPVFVESQIILNELDNPVADNYEFTIYGENTGVPDFPIEVSEDGINFSASIVVKSKDAKIKFYATVPTKKGLYRVIAKPKNGTVTGRYFISVEPSQVALLGTIKGTSYEDSFPYNGRKDPSENYTLLGDGQSSTYLYVGPILDAYGNPVSQARIRLTVDKGTLISSNPTGISDGVGIFRLESIPDVGSISILAEALNNADQVIASTTGMIELVRPKLTLQSDGGDFGQVFVNQTETKTFILVNEGNTISRNIIKSVDQPYVLEQSSTCLTVSQLRPGEQCTLVVSFTGGIRSTFPGNLRVNASPTTIAENTIVFPLNAQAVAPAIIGVSDIAYSINNQACGTTKDYAIHVANTGDLPGTGLTVTQPVRSNGQPRDVSFIIPPADVNPSQDPEDVINCGTTIPAGRKCRVIIRFQPNALRTDEPLTGSIAVDGREPITLTIRASSVVGPPTGNIPVVLVNPSNQIVTSMDIGDTNYVKVKVGPVADACNNPIHDYPVSAVTTAGTITVSPINTNNGFTEFAWYGSSSVSEIGVQQVSVSTSHESGTTATGNKSLTFDGVKLITTPVTGAIGQILTVNYIPPKYFFYTVKNEGTVPALNITKTVEPASSGNWFIIEQQFAGGCEDNTLQPGETCTVRVKVDTQAYGPGALTGQFMVRATGKGLVETATDLLGVSVNPPVMAFDGAPVVSIPSAIAGSRPSQVLTLRNTSGNASVFGLAVNVAPPFEKIDTTCTTTLNPNSNCTLTVRLPVDTKGNYNSFIQATSEYSSSSVTVTGNIVSNLAAGTIPMVFDKVSVPASPTNPSAFINVTLGPIKDAYGNNVVAGTVVNLSSDKGIMSIDTDSDGFATATTGSGVNEGKLSFTIRAKSVTEITNFTIQAKVMNGLTELASGSKSGSFTGALVAFADESIDFGQVAVGALDFRVIRLRNNGNEAATNITWNTTSSDFNLSGQGGCTSLAAGAFCDVTVLVNPVQSGSLTGSVNVNAAGNGIISDTLALTATAVNAAKIVAGNNYNDPADNYDDKTLRMNHTPGSVSTGQFRIRNVGQENLETLIASINTRSSEFNLSLQPSCQTLGFDQECVVTVTFNPTAQVPSQILGEITLTAESPSRVTIDKINIIITSPQLAFTLKEATLQQGLCGAFRVQLQDSSEQGVPVAASNVGFNLAKTGGTGTFYSNSTCTSAITVVNISSGQSSSPIFYYKGTSDGDHTLTVSNTTKTVQTLTKVFQAPQIVPATITVAPNGSVNFSTNNGVNPYNYQVITANGGSIGSSNGNYTAPLIAGNYTIRVTDNIGNISEAVVTVEDIKIAAGKNYWCSTSVGSIKCLGENAFGQYGANAVRKGNFNESIPVGKFVTYSPSISGTAKTFYAGAYTSCVSRADNRLYCQGANHLGSVGDGSYTDKNAASSVSGSFTIFDGPRSVANSWGLHTCAIRSDNRLYCWGNNNRGQVGTTNSVMAFNTPQQVTVSGANDFTRVVSGVNHTCALHSSGTVNCFGDNTYGQLGDNTNTSRIGSSSVVVGTSGTGTLSNIREISAGRYHTCAVDNSNNLYCWGRNDLGQLGNNTITDSVRPILIAADVKNIYAGGKHNCLVKNSTNQMQCWGNNTSGQLGQGNLNVIRVPTNVSGINSQIGEVSLGENFSCFVHQYTNLKCMGENTYGQMGSNDLNNISSVSTINPGGGNINCGSGLSYDSGTTSCKCSSASNLYGYESKTCVAPTLTNLNTLLLEYGKASQNFPVGFAFKQASILYSNVPVVYSRTGNGSLYYSKIITDSDGPVNNNIYVRGNQNFESVTATVASLSQTVNYRLYKTTCDDYVAAYGDLTSGVQILLDQTATPYSAYCRFFGNPQTYAYSYLTLADYNRTYSEVYAAEDSTVSLPCVYGTDYENVVGSYHVSTPFVDPYVPFVYDDLVRTGFVINDDLNGDPSELDTKQGYVRWNCR